MRDGNLLISISSTLPINNVLEVTMRDGNTIPTSFMVKLKYSSFRSDYEGWKPIQHKKNKTCIYKVLEVTMRDGN